MTGLRYLGKVNRPSVEVQELPVIVCSPDSLSCLGHHAPDPAFAILGFLPAGRLRIVSLTLILLFVWLLLFPFLLFRLLRSFLGQADADRGQCSKKLGSEHVRHVVVQLVVVLMTAACTRSVGRTQRIT